MESPLFKTYTLKGFVFALIANIFIIIALTQLIKAEAEKSNDMYFKAVTIAHFRPTPPKKIIEEQEKEKEKEVKKEEIKKPSNDDIFTDNPDIDIDIPEFEVNTRIDGAGFKIPNMKPASIRPKTDYNKLFSLKNLDQIPVPKFKKSPVYPYRAKRMGVEGYVSVSFIVDKNGKVSNIKILDSQPKNIFDQSVINALSSWEYAPGELNGKNVKTLVSTKILFKLEE